jgi:hypothetical protein
MLWLVKKCDVLISVIIYKEKINNTMVISISINQYDKIILYRKKLI